MKKLIQVISLAIAAIAGLKSANAALKEENDQLKARVGNEDADDAARDNELKQARLKQSQLEAEIEEANKKSDELAELLNSEPGVPSVDPGTFKVTEPPTVGPQDIEFRDRQEESQGKVVNAAFPTSDVNTLEREATTPATNANDPEGNPPSENTPSDNSNKPEGEQTGDQK